MTIVQNGDTPLHLALRTYYDEARVQKRIIMDLVKDMTFKEKPGDNSKYLEECCTSVGLPMSQFFVYAFTLVATMSHGNQKEKSTQ